MDLVIPGISRWASRLSSKEGEFPSDLASACLGTAWALVTRDNNRVIPHPAFPPSVTDRMAGAITCRCTTLTLHALGAAIPLCLSLALAIRDAIPGGEPTGDEPSDAEMNGQEGKGPLVKLEVVTGSKDVHDEITPDDEVRVLTRHRPREVELLYRIFVCSFHCTVSVGS